MVQNLLSIREVASIMSVPLQRAYELAERAQFQACENRTAGSRQSRRAPTVHRERRSAAIKRNQAGRTVGACG